MEACHVENIRKLSQLCRLVSWHDSTTESIFIFISTYLCNTNTLVDVVKIYFKL